MTFLFLVPNSSFFFILCGYIDCAYIYYSYTKWKLSPTLLWVWKFHVKLGVGVKIFKITIGRWLFYFWFKTCISFCFSMGFQNLMFKSSKLVAELDFDSLYWFLAHTYNVPPGSSDSASKPSAKREFDGTGRDGTDGDQKCPSIFFILCEYIDKVYTYLYRY